RQQRGGAVLRVQQEELGKLAASGVAREHEPGTPRLPPDLADRVVEPGELSAGGPRRGDMMDLVDVREAGGDVHPGAGVLAGPVEEPGGANVLVTVQVIDDLLRDRRHVLHDEVAVIRLGTQYL